MRFEQPAGDNPIDQGRVVGKPHDRIDGVAKVTGTAHYAYERHDVVPDPAYGWMVGAAIATGRILRIDSAAVLQEPGVLAVVTHENAGPLGKVDNNPAPLLGGPQIAHYDQAVALVVAKTLEQARDAARRLRIDYAATPGRFDLAAARAQAGTPPPFMGRPSDTAVGDFEGAFARAAVQIDQTYTTPGQSHQMMEPPATTAAWSGDRLTLWTSNQMIAQCHADMATLLGIDPANVRLISPYVGGGFGGKLWLRADALLAALGARAAQRAVKVALARPQVPNNTVHRSATIQRVQLGASRDGRIAAIAHQSCSGNLPGGKHEAAAMQTRLLYAGANRRTAHRLALLDLPEANAMRAPGEAAGMLALEIAMDELAEACGLDPVELRIRNDTQYDPEVGPTRPFSTRMLVQCLRTGADRFGWAQRVARPGQRRDGRWLVGMGVAAAFRNNLTVPSAARVGVDGAGRVRVETDMTDIGTGSYTIIAQTAAEMLGVPLALVDVRLGDSQFPASCGSGGQFGGNCSTAGVYAACVALRDKLARQAGLTPDATTFADARLRSGTTQVTLAQAAGAGGTSAEGRMTFRSLQKKFAQAAFGAQFCEVGVDVDTGETRVRRQLGVFAAGRILNPKTARSQIVGSMTMGVGAALMEELVVDPHIGCFVNHDLAEYHVPVHADIAQQDVVFLDELDDKSSPMKAKGVGEVGICGAGAAVANAIYNACGVRLRDYPMTLDKLLPQLRTA
jgi:xanthine dehydrogenase YagR molybdenum-binding subunit